MRTTVSRVVVVTLFLISPSRASADISTGLKGAFGFEEGSGIFAADQSGNQGPATLVNNPAWSSGKIGTSSLLFDKVNDFINAGNGSNLANLELQGGGGMSISFWIKPTTLGHQVIMNKGSGSAYSFGLYTNPDGRIIFARQYSSTALTVRHENMLMTGQWQHVLMTWNGNSDLASVKIYRNGVQQTGTYGTAGSGTKNNDSSLNMYIGAENGSYGINGSLDDVRFYSRVLTGTDASELFNYNGSGGPVDVVPPIRTSGAPSGLLPPGTLTTTLSLNTDELATCKYGTTANTNYAALPHTFGATGGTSHSQSLGGLTNDTSYSYVIRCEDTVGNTNTNDFLITFAVGSPTGGGAVTFADTLLVNGLSFPTAMAFAPDGRILVTEKDSGRIRVIKNGALLPTPFATVSVRNENERGLLGLAIDPNFSTNGNVYVYHTANSGSEVRNRITKLKASSTNSDVSDGAQTIIFELQPLDSGYHNGGALLFGNDGKLYAAIGENGYEDDSQNINSFRGKIIRINADGSIPADNPTSFDGVTGTTTGVYRAVWAIGFRNPFTFAVDPISGDISVNDVGDGMWEEINALSKGGNFGWPICEGSFFHATVNTCNTPGFTNPIYAYSHVSPMRGGGSNASIAGGAFYRGNQFPLEYDGAYFFADVVDWFIDVRMPNGEIRNIADPIEGMYPLDLDVGPDGLLYYLTHASPNNLGSVYRITAVYDGNLQPDASFAVTPAFGVPPLNVSIDASASSDPNNDSLTYEWEFGDGATQSGLNLEQVNHTYADAGRYTITLRVVDPGDLSDVETRTVSVGNAPTGVVAIPIAGSHYTAGDTISYSGSGTDPEDGTLPASAFSWTIAFHHGNHTHPVLGPVNGVTSGSFMTETVHEAATDVFYRVNLTVTDSTGLRHTSYVDVLPRKSTITLASNVSGISFTVDGAAYTSPFESVAGIIRTLAAPVHQTVGTSTFEFVSWSDSGTATHQIATPLTNTTYTATYNLLPPPPTSLLTGLKAYFAFDESAGGTAVDSSGNQGAASVLNNPVWTTGRVGSHALLFDKANDFVNAGAGANTADLENQGGGGMSIAFWIKPTTLGSHAVIAKGSGSSYGYVIYMNPYGRIIFDRKYSSAALNVRHDNIFVANQWQHVVLTWTGNSNIASVKIYRNGVQQTGTYGTAGSGTKNNDSSLNMYIGAENGTYGINGSMDDVRFYSRVLTSTDALELFNYDGLGGPVDVVPPIRTNGAPSGLLPAGTATTTLSLNTDELATCKYGTTANTNYAALPHTFGATGGTSHSQSLGGLTNDTSYSYVIRCEDTVGNTNTNDFLITFAVGSPTGLKAYFAFDESAGDTAVDSSGNQGAASVLNSPVWTTGRVGSHALLFDKANDFVNAGASANTANLENQGGGGMSIAFWIRPTTLGSHAVIAKGSGSSYGYVIYMNPDGRIIFDRKYSSAALNVRHDNIFVANQWQHVVLTWTGNSNIASVKIYKNGVQQTATYGTAGVGTKTSDSPFGLYIGAENGAYGINGAIDDARFYNRILTPTEISELANQ